MTRRIKDIHDGVKIGPPFMNRLIDNYNRLVSLNDRLVDEFSEDGDFPKSVSTSDLSWSEDSPSPINESDMQDWQDKVNDVSFNTKHMMSEHISPHGSEYPTLKESTYTSDDDYWKEEDFKDWFETVDNIGKAQIYIDGQLELTEDGYEPCPEIEESSDFDYDESPGDFDSLKGSPKFGDVTVGYIIDGDTYEEHDKLDGSFVIINHESPETVGSDDLNYSHSHQYDIGTYLDKYYDGENLYVLHFRAVYDTSESSSRQIVWGIKSNRFSSDGKLENVDFNTGTVSLDSTDGDEADWLDDMAVVGTQLDEDRFVISFCGSGQYRDDSYDFDYSYPFHVVAVFDKDGSDLSVEKTRGDDMFSEYRVYSNIRTELYPVEKGKVYGLYTELIDEVDDGDDESAWVGFEAQFFTVDGDNISYDSKTKSEYGLDYGDSRISRSKFDAYNEEVYIALTFEEGRGDDTNDSTYIYRATPDGFSTVHDITGSSDSLYGVNFKMCYNYDSESVHVYTQIEREGGDEYIDSRTGDSVDKVEFDHAPDYDIWVYEGEPVHSYYVAGPQVRFNPDEDIWMPGNDYLAKFEKFEIVDDVTLKYYTPPPSKYRYIKED